MVFKGDRDTPSRYLRKSEAAGQHCEAQFDQKSTGSARIVSTVYRNRALAIAMDYSEKGAEAVPATYKSFQLRSNSKDI